MPALREPSLGPIVGHTSDTACRIWVRGSDTEDHGAGLNSERRTVGVCTLFEIPGKDADKLRSDDGLRLLREAIAKSTHEELKKAREGKPHALPPLYYFRLHREYDRTGAFLFGVDRCLTGRPSPPLKPDTPYLALTATLVVDDPFADDRNVSSGRLADKLPDPSSLSGSGCSAS